MRIAVHITHEALRKIGGIGEVIHGWCSAESYWNFFERTLIYGPIFESYQEAIEEIKKNGSEVLSATGGGVSFIDRVSEKYGVKLVFGKKFFSAHKSAEILLIYVKEMKSDEVNKFKYFLWENFHLPSLPYEGNWDYEQYVRIAVPLFEILRGLYPGDNEFYIFAHEYMGLPSALSLAKMERMKTIFVAHEVPPARSIVENHPGHDITFYNLMKKLKGKKSLEEIFGSQKNNPRSELVKRSSYLDLIFCVSDFVKDEILFLEPSLPEEKIKIVYNGLWGKEVNFDRKLESREKIRNFIQNALGFLPDIIFTHVARFVLSKAFWRDLTLLHYLHSYFKKSGLKSAYILLSSLLPAGRREEDVLKMEREYGWPLHHRENFPDLLGWEREIYGYIKDFNENHSHVKGIFINQFGFDRKKAGTLVPEGTSFFDLRCGSDAEIGLSIYEPFGISHGEVIPFGGISIVSTSCGIYKFLRKKLSHLENILFFGVDFTGEGEKFSPDELMNLNIERRHAMEKSSIQRTAGKVFELLPKNEKDRRLLLEKAQECVKEICWEKIFREFIEPALSSLNQ